MLSGHVEGQFLKLMVAISGAERILKLVSSGYSVLAMAEAPRRVYLLRVTIQSR